MPRPKSNSKRLMTQKAYADLRRVSPQYVNKLVKEGKILKVGKFIDRDQADEARKAFQRAGRVIPAQRRSGHRSPAKAHEPRAPRGGETLTGWRMQSEKYKAQKLQLEFEQTIGKLLDRDQVLAAERRKNERIRGAFRALPRSLAPVIARCATAADAEITLREEIDRVLQRLAEDPLGMQETAALAVTATTEAEPAAPASMPPAPLVQTPALESEAHA